LPFVKNLDEARPSQHSLEVRPTFLQAVQNRIPLAAEFAAPFGIGAMLERLGDGPILKDGLRRETFLSAVRESLPDPKTFLRHPKLKAGLSVDCRSESKSPIGFDMEFFAPAKPSSHRPGE
jgi:hypothetical protein